MIEKSVPLPLNHLAALSGFLRFPLIPFVHIIERQLVFSIIIYDVLDVKYRNLA